jgi:hypothetical protein
MSRDDVTASQLGGCSLAASPRSEEKVRYIHESPGRWSGNIMFSRSYRARNGRFPADHPCAAGSEVFGTVGDSQSGDGPTLKAFRERGYWASCFPEGDGITLNTKNGQAASQVINDIREVFGWKVVAK